MLQLFKAGATLYFNVTFIGAQRTVHTTKYKVWLLNQSIQPGHNFLKLSGSRDSSSM